ncbi:hypothetical protein O181_107826 [Austropuccinia psidii MF-1]|uniref:Uncharacterized protein n=1 Tax=Austropuccinia psidii MF-1 TaxID=1389203 RepID=A0A9Q3JTM7_9BASI|nr:hypothetical protein [Austropuccinia psidii MF-1]
MPVQHSLPAMNTRSQRHQAILTPIARALLDCTQSVHQLSANLDRRLPMEGAAPSRRGGVNSRRSGSFSGFLGGYPSIPQGPRSISGEAEDTASEAPNLAHSNQPLDSQAEPNFLKMMEQMTQFMEQLTQSVAPRDTSKAPTFKNPSIKAPDCFDGTKAYKFRGFIQSCQLIFHNNPANFSSYRKKEILTSVRQSQDERKWSGFLVNRRLQKLNFKNWRLGERAYIHVYRRGLASILLDQLASHPQNFDKLQELMEITLELDTRYHERQKEKGSHQENNPPISGANSSKPPQSSSSKKPYHRKNKKGIIFKCPKTCLMLLSSLRTTN